MKTHVCGLTHIAALALVEFAAAFSAPALLASRTVVGSPVRCGAPVYFLKSLKQAQDPPSPRATAATERNSALRLYAEAGGGGNTVDENYYSVAAIRGKQAVANPARGGMVRARARTRESERASEIESPITFTFFCARVRDGQTRVFVMHWLVRTNAISFMWFRV